MDLKQLDSAAFLDHVLIRSPSVEFHIAPIRDSLLKLYSEYARRVRGFGAPTPIIPSLSKEAAARLHYAYSHFVVADSGFLNGRSIFNRLCVQYVHCLYCDAGEVSELDHFLPKKIDKWPEYSILFENLVPACRRCNGYKLESSELARNPLVADPLANEYIVMSVEYIGSNIELRYGLDFPSHYSSELAFALSEQFRLLRLAERFENKARDFISNQRTVLLEKLHEGGPSQVRSYLVLLEYIAGRRYNPNHWELVALRGLVCSERFHTLEHWTGVAPEFQPKLEM